MKAAAWPREIPHEARLLYVNENRRTLSDHSLFDLPRLLSPDALVLLNDAGTLPASVPALDNSYELRLMAFRQSDNTWQAFLLGAGDHRVPTEKRGPPPDVRLGQRLAFGEGLSATVVERDNDAPQLIRVRFDLQGERFFYALYRAARPIQYAYVEKPLELWHVQNRFAGAPWALENPSAGAGLSWELLTALRKAGIEWATLTHAAGISSTGSAPLDARLPTTERYLIPERTARAITQARRERRQIVAIGTTVVRALESNALEHGAVAAGPGDAKLVILPGFRPRIVDTLLSGMHEPTTSHYALLQAFASRALLDSAMEHAERSGYLQHEFGDACLISHRGGTRRPAPFK